MLLTFVIGYLLTTLLIGYWASKRVQNSSDYILAGRQLPLLLASSALFATWFGSETVLGASSEFARHGIIGVIEDPFGAALCLLMVAIFVARPLYRMNILTFGDFYRIKFGPKTEIISSLFMVPSYFGWIAAQLVALGILLEVITGLPNWAGILIGTSIVLIYTYIGGMWAISITDFVQTVVIICGLGYMLWVVMEDAGGWQKVMASTPTDFFRFTPKENSWNSWVSYLAAWITIGFGSIPQQDVFQRIMAAKSEKTAVISGYLGSFMYLTIAFLPLLMVLAAKTIYPELAEGGDLQLLLPQVIMQHFSVFVQILFFGALLSAIMSTTSGAILAPASILSENLIKPIFKINSDQQMLTITRWAVVFIAGAACLLANLNSNIYELVGSSSVFSLVSLFVPMVAGLYFQPKGETGAILSMVAGMLGWIIFEVFPLEIPSLVPALLLSITGFVAGSLNHQLKN